MSDIVSRVVGVHPFNDTVYAAGHDPNYYGEPFVVLCLYDKAMYYADPAEAQSYADERGVSAIVLELHQEYEIDVLHYEYRGEGGELLAGWSCEGVKAGAGLDIEMDENSTLTITHGRMLKRDFEDMEEFEGY